MSWVAMQSQQTDGPVHCVSKVKALKQAIATQQDYHQATTTWNPDAVDAALLHAKLEVVRLELDAEKHAAREQRRSLYDPRHAVFSDDPSQARASTAYTQRQKALMRRSLPATSQQMADGKPVYNTAQLLASLGTDRSTTAISHPPIQEDQSIKKHKRTSYDPIAAENRWTCQDSEDDDDYYTARSKHDSVLFRRSRVEESAPIKLVATKHGSQTVYEKVEMPRPGLIEEAEDSDIDSADCTRPRLNKHDRPHWAQQSNDAHDGGLFKQLTQGVRKGGSRPLSELPHRLESNGCMAACNSQLGHETLIADAVHQIKREQRSRKWQTVQNFLKRASYS